MSRNQWLSDHGVTEKDVMKDEEGHEYIIVEAALMDEGEPEDGRSKKVYLPNDLINEEQV